MVPGFVNFLVLFSVGYCGGGLAAACSSFREDSWLFIFSVVPLFLVLSQVKATFFKSVIILGYFSGLFFFLFEGLMPFLQLKFELSYFQSAMALFFLSVLSQFPLSLLVSISLLLAKRLGLRIESSLILFCFSILVGRVFLPELFPTTYSMALSVGESSWKNLFSVVGPEGLEFFINILNGYVAFSVVGLFKRNRIEFWGNFSKAVFLTMALLSVSFAEESRWNDRGFEFETLHFWVFQPGVVDYVPGEVDFNRTVEKKNIDLVEGVLSEVKESSLATDVVIFPEGFMYSNINTFEENSTLLMELIRRYQIPIISGGNSLLRDQSTNYNSLFYLDDDGNLDHLYHKFLLMPFGETKPLRHTFPKLSAYIPGKNVYAPGQENHNSILRLLGKVNLGLGICYEDIADSVFRFLAKNDADIFLMLTSDNQFGSRFFALNHLSATVARALSYRRPLIRVTSTGISAIVDAQGRFLQKTGYRTRELHFTKLRYVKNQEASLFSYFANFQVPLFGLVSALLIVCIEYRGYRADTRNFNRS